MSTMQLEGWWHEAACAGLPVEAFLPPPGGRGESTRVRAAKRICADCPVTRECLAEAERIGDGFTIRGGLTPTERGWDAKRRRKDDP